MSGPARFVSGLALLVSGPRRSLCRVSGSALFVRAGALYVGARRSAALSQDFVSPSGLCVGPRAVCVGARRCVCRGPALLGPARGAALFVSGLGALSVGLCQGLFRGSPSLHNALCVGPRQFLFRSSCSSCRGPALSGGLSVSGPGAGSFCVGPRRSLCRGLAVCLSRPNNLCVGARRSLCRGPALFVSGPGDLSGPRRFVMGPGTARRSLRRGPALLVSGRRPRFLSGAPCVGSASQARRSSPKTLFVRCVGPRHFLSGPGALYLCRGPAACVSRPNNLCIGAQRFLALCAPRPDAASRLPGFTADRTIRPANPPTPTPIRVPPPPIRVPPIQPCAPPSSDPRATPGLRGPPLRSACHPSSSNPRATHPARRVPFFSGENPKPYCLGESDSD